MQESINKTNIKLLKRGLLTLPKKIRDLFHLKEGDILTIEIQDEAIIIKPTAIMNIDKDQAYFWAEECQKNVAKGLKDYEEGRYKTFDNIDDLINELDKI